MDAAAMTGAPRVKGARKAAIVSTRVVLTKEQRLEMEGKLRMPWGVVRLKCDGRVVTLQVERSKNLSFRIYTYIDGQFLGSWMVPVKGVAAPETKFLRKSVRPNFSAQKKAKWEKQLGKRYVKNDPWMSGSMTIFYPCWATGKAVLNHLSKVCLSVEELDIDGHPRLKMTNDLEGVDDAI